jgi:hypothetical protein
MESVLPTVKRRLSHGRRSYATIVRYCLRAMVILVTLQFTGLLLGIASLSTNGEPRCPATCSDEDTDQGLACAPFCATCTCVHARPLGLDRTPSCEMGAPRLVVECAILSLAATVPPCPEPDRVFRPPRTDSV